MKTVLMFLFLVGVAFAAEDTPMKPLRLRELTLQKIPLKERERIASVEIEIVGASFDSVRIPSDWSFDVGAPISGVATLKGEAMHGVGMPFTAQPFRRLATLAFYDYGQFQQSFSIKVKLGLYLFHEGRESERTIVLAPESVVLTEPNKALEPTPTAVTPPAAQEPRQP